jgi:Domain of unknown function DUF29
MAETAAPTRPAELGAAPGYDEDFFLWTERQAALIRAGQLDSVDWENVAEEIESLGRRDLRQIGNRLEVLLSHLLKWQFQPAARSTSWRGTIRTQRGRILRVLRDSPSLRQHVDSEARDAYPRARAGAADEAGLGIERFPAACPYSAAELLDDDFWPEADGAA